MKLSPFVICCGIIFASWLLTKLVRHYSLKNRLLDVPNHRSSHTVPTPSGGGIAIVSAFFIGVSALAVTGDVDGTLLLALLPSLMMLVAIGFVDDRFDISPLARFAVHAVSATWFVVVSGEGLRTGVEFVDGSTLLSQGLAMLSLVWLINLYNFMDGIDGLAACEAVVIAVATALFCLMSGTFGVANVSLVLAAACMGFLSWNWPPAKIFMGDAGSSCIGFAIGALAMSAASQTGATIWPWVIMLGIFLIDATFTLLCRLATGQKWYEAHRSHAYQILSRRWGCHRPVTIVVCLINIFWLVPLAAAAVYLPAYAGIFVILGLAPLAVVAWRLGAGRPEELPLGNTLD